MSRRATLVGPVLAALLINAGSPRSASADRRFRVPDYNEWGVMIDAGVPDGFNGAVT